MKSLYDIALKFALRKKETDESNILFYLTYARDAVNELNITSDNKYCATILEIDSNSKTAKLPHDYQKLVRLGLHYDGRIMNLDYDNTIPYTTNQQEEWCDDSKTPQEELEDFDTTADNVISNNMGGYQNLNIWDAVYNQGKFVGRMYGVPANNKKLGTYRIDKKGRLIYFSSMVSSTFQAVLEYKSNGIDNTKMNYVDDIYEAAIIAYIRYHTRMELSKPIGTAAVEWERQSELLKHTNFSAPLHRLVKSVRNTIFTGNINR